MMAPKVICYRYRRPSLIVIVIREANVESADPIRYGRLSRCAYKRRVDASAEQCAKWNITLQLATHRSCDQFFRSICSFTQRDCKIGRDGPLMISLRSPQNTVVNQPSFQYFTWLKSSDAHVKSLRRGNVKQRSEIMDGL